MARSKRKTPIIGMCADTDKPFKVVEHRRERRAVKVALRVGDAAPHPKLFGDPWDGCKDGKAYLAEPEPRDMRK